MRRRGLRRLGLALLLAGLGVLGWVGWQYLGTDYTSNREMDRIQGDLRQDWAGPAPRRTPDRDLGEAIALVRIPRFGAEWEKPVVHGVRADDLARGIGHYEQTALPGQVGNFAIAGHRVTHGSPFRKLLMLQPGDQVIVETADAVYTYAMDSSPRDLTVKPDATWVLDPVPGKADATPARATITLTTCQDLFRSPDRSVGFGHLVRTERKR
jgi:sortase A